MSSTNNQPVLFIARVFPNIHEKRIRGIIGALKIGSVDRVDMKSWTNKEGKSFNKVYIHLNWNTDAETIKIVTRLNDGKDIKIVYDDPWFWKLSLSRSARPLEAPKPYSKPTISIHRARVSEEEKIPEECVCQDGGCDTCVKEALNPMTQSSFSEEDALSEVLKHLQEKKAPKLVRQVCKDLF